MIRQSFAAFFTRSFSHAQSPGIQTLLKQSIAERIDELITRNPSCPRQASTEVDQLTQTDERLGGEQCL